MRTNLQSSESGKFRHNQITNFEKNFVWYLISFLLMLEMLKIKDFRYIWLMLIQTTID